MCTDKDPPPCEHGELIALVSRQQDQVARLTTTIKELRKHLVAAQRAGKRQAAPFSKGRQTSKPRRPGRKPGMGNFSYRKPPSADELWGPPVDVSVADDNCPGCGGVLEQEGVDVAYVTDIPAMPRPEVTEATGCRRVGVVAAADGYEDAMPRLVRTSTGQVRTGYG